jgi:hypothetical protein
MPARSRARGAFLQTPQRSLRLAQKRFEPDAAPEKDALYYPAQTRLFIS